MSKYDILISAMNDINDSTKEQLNLTKDSTEVIVFYRQIASDLAVISGELSKLNLIKLTEMNVNE